MYVGTTGGKVFAFNTATGKEKWSVITTDGTSNNVVVSSPVLSSDGKVLYVGDEKNNTYAFNAGNGNQIWKTSLFS